MRRMVLSGTVLAIAAWLSHGYAQTLPVTPSFTQPNPLATSPVTISPIQPASAPTSGIPANIITPSTTNQLEPSARAQARGGQFTGAGRGLPGMPGGPPVNSAVGAKDPTTDYMSPPAVGSLFCDPDIDSPC